MLPNAMIVVAIAALIGGRLYHVIDQSAALQGRSRSRSCCRPIRVSGVYGGIIAGTIAAGCFYARWRSIQPFLRWADGGRQPGLFVMQAVARWGNFFNGSCTVRRRTCPGGSPSSAQYDQRKYAFVHPALIRRPRSARRISSRCSSTSRSSGLARRHRPDLGSPDASPAGSGRGRPCCWSSSSGTGSVRFVVESLKADNWLFFGVPTAQIVAAITVVDGGDPCRPSRSLDGN